MVDPIRNLLILASALALTACVVETDEQVGGGGGAGGQIEGQGGDDGSPADAGVDEEICGDGLDNDGDGQIDEGCDDVIPPPQMGCAETGCPVGQICDEAAQLCMPVACQVDADCPAEAVCVAGECAAGDPQGEICADGLDNDGDGQVDEGCGEDPGDCGPEGCPEGTVCEPATGVCLPAEAPVIQILPETIDFGVLPPGQVNQAEVMIRNAGGQALTFDAIQLNGSQAFTVWVDGVDPRLDLAALADPDGDGEPGLAPSGEIILTVQVGPLAGDTHEAEVLFQTNDPAQPQALLTLRAEGAGDGEICGDGLDNDGDGQVDEGCEDPNGAPCNADADCAPGQLCVNGLCGGDDPVDPGVDGCDGLDNDRDGQVDEDCDPNDACLDAAGVPVPCECQADADCPAGQACVDGACGDAPRDLCDGIDNDGDGIVDEDCDPNAQQCNDDSLCAAGEQCINGRCQVL